MIITPSPRLDYGLTQCEVDETCRSPRHSYFCGDGTIDADFDEAVMTEMAPLEMAVATPCGWYNYLCDGSPSICVTTVVASKWARCDDNNTP